jgi:ATP-dependent Lon protease, bacterial type
MADITSIRPDLSLRRFDEILAMQFDASDNILGDHQLAKGQNTCFVGPPGAGKTRLIMQMAIAGIVGRDFVGMEMQGRSLKWLFMQVENSNRRLQTDLAHFRKWVGDEVLWQAVVDQCLVHTLEHDGDGLVFLDNATNRDFVGKAIQTRASDVVVWDSLQNYSVGDLNKDADMFKSLHEISLLTKRGNTQALPLVIHHALTGRAGAIKLLGMEKGSYSRNSKAITAWARSQINVAVASPNSYETIIMACGKCSDGKEFEAFAVKFNEETHIYERNDEFDIEEWAKQVKSNKGPNVKIPDSVIADACNGYKMSLNDLFVAVKAKVGTSVNEATIYRSIERAAKHRAVKFDKKLSVYTKPGADV